MANNGPTDTQTIIAELLLFDLLLCQGLLQELPYSFLFDSNRLVPSRRLIGHFVGHGIGIRHQLASPSIYVVFLGLRAELLLALRLGLFEVDGDALAIVCDENSILVLDDCDAV